MRALVLGVVAAAFAVGSYKLFRDDRPGAAFLFGFAALVTVGCI